MLFLRYVSIFHYTKLIHYFFMPGNICWDYYFIFLRLILLLEREEKRETERERDIDEWEKNQLVASCAPHPGTETATQACALIRNWNWELSLCRTTPTNWATLVWGDYYFCLKFRIWLWPSRNTILGLITFLLLI